jgi:hypothetical protein
VIRGGGLSMTGLEESRERPAERCCDSELEVQTYMKAVRNMDTAEFLEVQQYRIDVDMP